MMKLLKSENDDEYVETSTINVSSMQLPQKSRKTAAEKVEGPTYALLIKFSHMTFSDKNERPPLFVATMQYHAMIESFTQSPLFACNDLESPPTPASLCLVPSRQLNTT